MGNPFKVNPLVELAEVRREEVTIAGHKVICVEPGAVIYSDYRTKLNGDPKADPPIPGDKYGAVAILIFNCVLNPEDDSPYFTEEDALKVARGRSQVFGPLMIKITGWIGREKKGSETTLPEGSSTN